MVRFLQGGWCLLNNHRAEFERMCRQSFDAAKRSSSTRVWYLATALNAMSDQPVIPPKEALELARRTFEKEQLPHYKYVFALCLLRAEKYEEALSHFRGNFITVHQARAIIRVKLGDIESANMEWAAAQRFLEQESAGPESNWPPDIRLVIRLLHDEVQQLLGESSPSK